MRMLNRPLIRPMLILMHLTSNRPVFSNLYRTALLAGALMVAAGACSAGDTESLAVATTTSIPAPSTTATSTTVPEATTSSTSTTTTVPVVDPERASAAIEAVRTYRSRVLAVRLDPQGSFEGLDEMTAEPLLEDIIAGIEFDRANQIRTSGEVTISEEADVEALNDDRLRVTICVEDSTVIDASDAPSNIQIIDRTTEDIFGRPVLVIYLVDDSSGQPLVTSSLLPGGAATDCELAVS